MKINSSKYFILDENKNTIPASLIEWANFLEYGQKTVAKDYIVINDFCVSTVFLGLDHNHFDFIYDSVQKDCRPHIFETMVFDSEGNDIYCDRYSTWKEAEDGHKKAIEWVLKTKGNNE